MAWSYQKQIKIFPEVTLHFNDTGISTSIAGKRSAPIITNHTVATYDNNIFSADILKITSQNMQGIKDIILAARQQKKDLQNDLVTVEKDCNRAGRKLKRSYIFLYGFINKSIPERIKKDLAAQDQAIEQIKYQIKNSHVRLTTDFSNSIGHKYNAMADAFRQLVLSQKIWDVTSLNYQDRVKARSYAGGVVHRKEVRFSVKSLTEIASEHGAFYFQNANGADLFFYPGFIIMSSDSDRFAIIGFDEIDVDFKQIRFVEDEKIPGDSMKVDTTWLKVNKNGTPDKRFNANRQIPVMRYAEIGLKTRTGLNEAYQFSNFEAADTFSRAVRDYQSAIKRH